jgi:sulfite reductase beta subunit-like hemoprotein
MKKRQVAEKGVAWIKGELERRLGHALARAGGLPALEVADHLGWHEQGDGRYWYGIPVSSGRIADSGTVRLRQALRELIARFSADPILTADQNILLSNLAPQAREEIERILHAHGVPLAHEIRPLERWALACPALPSCGLALAEGERVKERLVAALQAQLDALGLGREPISVRLTGCPNGCARPYSAEIGIVGRMPGHYTVFVGGDFAGTHLGFALLDKVALDDVAGALGPLFERFAAEREAGESFGAFCRRHDRESLRALAAAFTARERKEAI